MSTQPQTVRLIGGPQMGTVIAIPPHVVESRQLFFAARNAMSWDPSKNSHLTTLNISRVLYTPSKNPKYWAYRGYR